MLAQIVSNKVTGYLSGSRVNTAHSCDCAYHRGPISIHNSQFPTNHQPCRSAFCSDVLTFCWGVRGQSSFLFSSSTHRQVFAPCDGLQYTCIGRSSFQFQFQFHRAWRRLTQKGLCKKVHRDLHCNHMRCSRATLGQLVRLPYSIAAVK